MYVHLGVWVKYVCVCVCGFLKQPCPSLHPVPLLLDKHIYKHLNTHTHISVFAATISWEQTTPCLNTVVADTGLVVCPPDGHFKNVTVGCQYSFSLSAISPLYSLQLRQQKLASCINCLFDSNFSVVACSSPGLEKGMACCGNGLCDGVETGASCPTDCRQDDEMLTQTAVSAAENGWMSVASYTFTPTRGVEGRRLLRCFEGVTNAGAASADHFSNDVVDMRRTLTTVKYYYNYYRQPACACAKAKVRTRPKALGPRNTKLAFLSQKCIVKCQGFILLIRKFSRQKYVLMQRTTAALAMFAFATFTINKVAPPHTHSHTHAHAQARATPAPP